MGASRKEILSSEKTFSGAQPTARTSVRARERAKRALVLALVAVLIAILAPCPEVWLTKEVRSPEETALDRLGVAVIRGEGYNREVLEHLGVPPSAVRLLSDPVQNTVDEVRLIAGELGRDRGDRVILVTSKTHTRRVRATWSAIVGAAPRAVVRYAVEEPYHPGSWWRNTRDALDVSREVFGLMNVWVGFPVQPDRRRE